MIAQNKKETPSHISIGLTYLPKIYPLKIHYFNFHFSNIKVKNFLSGKHWINNTMRLINKLKKESVACFKIILSCINLIEY